MPPRHPGDPPWLPFAERCYGLGLYLFPNRFRNDYGECMRQAFRDRCREIGRGEQSALRVFALELAPDLITTFGREQMQAGLGDVFPRQIIVLMLFCLALTALIFKDEITPPILDQAVTLRNWTNNYIDQRHIDAQERILADTAAQLSGRGDAGSKALAAWALNTIAVRKESPYWAPDDQNEALYHRVPEDASAEHAQVQTLYRAVLADKPDAFALARAAESCRLEARCDDHEAVSRLTRLVPDNAYAWESALVSAREHSDPAAMRHALAGMAHARYYDAYEGRTVAEMLGAAKSIEPDDATRAAVIWERARDTGMLGFYYSDPATVYCSRRLRAEANADPQLRTDCLATFKLMSQATQLQPSLQGYRGIASLSADPLERSQAKQRIRELYWLAGMSFIDDGYARWPYKHTDAENVSWAKAFESGTGEVEATKRWFTARGLPEQPPASYRPAPVHYVLSFAQAE